MKHSQLPWTPRDCPWDPDWHLDPTRSPLDVMAMQEGLSAATEPLAQTDQLLTNTKCNLLLCNFHSYKLTILEYYQHNHF
ncbi:hypothetical protein HOLleu_20365 [Holothuria leucospilota]|uniref:Uncharacterized protein n=1 Tax=Holothuria leucospilota TaxID=206669 RepID=A0A9Q1H7Y6_HOLLE|nr:hypothetical protein HOLleu_20365 [Holothuria leucospilota]